MGLFNRKNGGLMDVIRCDQQDYLVWKWRPANQELNSTSKENAIRYGSTLHVKDGEMCVFVYKQKDQSLQDFITGPYEDTIKTANFPVLSSIVGAAFGGSSPFPAEVYFFNLQGNNQIKFGVPYFDVADPRFVDFTVPVAVRGQITFTLSDVKQFIKLNRLVDFSLERFSNQINDDLKKLVKEYVTNYPIESGISVLQIERKIAEISDLIQAKLTPHFSEDFGVTLKRFDLSTIEIDKESEDYKDFIHVTKEQQKIQAEQIGRRAQIDTDIYERRGHLGTEQQFIQAHAINQQTEVMKVAAESMGKMPSGVSGGGESFNPAGMMMGMAMGGAMAGQMTGMMNQMNNQIQNPLGQMSQPAPTQPMPQTPPPPVVQYNVSVNGQSFGPYNMQQLQQMVQSGQLTQNSYIWKQGMANWDMAGNIAELAPLFGSVPPPPPQMPPQNM